MWDDKAAGAMLASFSAGTASPMEQPGLTASDNVEPPTGLEDKGTCTGSNVPPSRNVMVITCQVRQREEGLDNGVLMHKCHLMVIDRNRCPLECTERMNTSLARETEGPKTRAQHIGCELGRAFEPWVGCWPKYGRPQSALDVARPARNWPREWAKEQRISKSA